MKKLLTTTIAVLCAAMAFAEGEPVITAWRTSINVNDKTDFASIYVSDLGTTITGDAKYSADNVTYAWEKSTDGGTNWVTYADGISAKKNNILPIYAGKYRCTVSVKKGGSATSNVIEITTTAGSTVNFNSNIPVISIRTDSDTLPPCNSPCTSGNKAVFEAKVKRSADCKIIWNESTTDVSENIYDGADFDASSGLLVYDKKVRINYRGSSSLQNSRKGLAFACGDDNCGTDGKWVKGKENMFNLSSKKDKDWILYASADDQTYMRNKLQLELYEEMTGNWNAHSRYVQLYIDGSYRGMYLFMEKNKQSSARIDIEDDGFIFKYDKTDRVDRVTNPETITLDDESTVEQNHCTFTTSKTGRTDVGTYGMTVDHAYEIVYPEYGDYDTLDDWYVMVDSLKTKINRFETAVSDKNYTKLRTLIDYESFADYFIIEELTKNIDGYRISQYFKYNTSTSKMKCEPLWDTELGINNSSNKGANSRSGLIIENADMYSSGDAFYIPFWWTGSNSSYSSGNGIYGDDCFKAKVQQRWAQHTAEGGPLTWTNISNKLNTYAVSTGKSVNSVFSDWFSGTDGRITKLGAIITGWSITPYVNSVTANFNGQASSVTEQAVAMDGSVTMEASATASSGTATLYYSWQRSDDGESNWVTLVDDDTSNSHTFSDIQESGYYRARAKSSDCDCIKYSSSNVLHVVVPETKVTCK